MTSNATTIADEDGDFEDWIELYNYGSEAINLEGFGLSDDYDNPFRWVFPAIVIEPGEFLLVWASGKDRTDPDAPLHTNFRISSAGEEVLITSPFDILLDHIPPTGIPTDISYGRFPDGKEELVFFDEPTPGGSNTTDHFKGILEDVVLSENPGFYSDTLWLELYHPDTTAHIYYTLDGSVPDSSSNRYTSSILITGKSDEENQHSLIPTNFISGSRGWTEPDGNVAKSAIIRAVAVKPGYINSPVMSASYFVFPEGEKKYSMDVVSIIAEHDAFFSDSAGIYVPGVNYVEDRDNTGNYFHRGDDWERPASFEFFAGDMTFKQNIGIRIHGGYTRRFPQKSFRLYARNEYGESRFNQQIFPDLHYTNYNRLLLRNSGNDWNFTMFRDAAAQSLIRHFDVDNQAYRPAVVFINGEYWGIKNLRERYDRHYLERVYGIDPDNIDLLTRRYSVKEGDNIHYNQMIDFITSNDLGTDSQFNKVNEMMDINNFLDYYSAQIYYGNTDWPQNNIDFWRSRVDYDSTAVKGHDGRWRWLLYDVDRSLGYTHYSTNMIEWVTDSLNQRLNAEWPNLILRNLLDNENFKHSFINRISDHLNTAFITSRVHSIIDSLKYLVVPEIEEHIKRWGHPVSKTRWNSNVRVMYTNASRRPSNVRQHIMDHFDIESKVDLTLKLDSLEHGYIRINTIDINPSTPGVPKNTYPWSGIYFHGIPVEIEAVPYEGYAFSHWAGTENQKDRVLKITPEGDINLKAHFIRSGYPEIINYWFFGVDLPNNTPLETIKPLFSQVSNTMIEYQSPLEGYPFDEDHEQWRTASLERRNAPTEINYHPEANESIDFNDSDMRGIQVRQPLADNSNESALIFHMPTLGFRDIIFRFAAMDEGAAERLVVDYSVSREEPLWTGKGLENSVIDLSSAYQLHHIDFSNIGETENNPYFKIRIRFDGEDMTASDDSRVTFNNFSLHGVPLNYFFYSKPEGDLNDLSTWGYEPDGSGESPPSFDLHTARFHICNREYVELDTDWSVTGIDSRVIAGDDINPLTFRVNATLDAFVKVESNVTMELNHSQMPYFKGIKKGSTVIVSDNATTIPYASYYNLTVGNIDPVFENDGEIQIRGDLTLDGTVQFPDARGEAEYDLRFTGDSEQLISGNGNVVRGYNVTFDKSGGSVSFSSENGGTILSSDNQIILKMDGEATFEDNGINIYAGNSVNISGAPESYNFTGTLILADSEEGVVKGAGSGNNFNIRDSNSNQANAAATLNNLIIRADNRDGEFRFRDGSSNLISLKGDLVVESGASGTVIFYGNQVRIGGNMIIEKGYTGSVDAIHKLIFVGQDNQILSVDGIIHADNLSVDNPDNLSLDGIVHVHKNLHFENGKIMVSENSLPKLGAGAGISGYDGQRFIDGRLGIYMNNIEPEEVIFPVGKDGVYLPIGLEISHANTNDNLYIAELSLDAPPELKLPGGLLQVFDDFYYTLDILGDFHISSGLVTMVYNPADLTIEEDLLRIAKSGNGSWINLGGNTEEGVIKSTIPFTSPGLFTLARQALEVSVTATAGAGGTIDPEGTDIVYQGTDKTYTARANEGYHIKNIYIDGDSLSGSSGNFQYTYTFDNIVDDRTIHVDFDLNKYHDVNIYPNPASDILWVEFMQNIEYTAIISLVNMSGQVITEKTLAPGDNISGFINLEGTDPGIYILKISYGQYKIYKRVVII